VHFDPVSFLTASLAVFVMLAILSILIIVHEFGHWSVARFFGFQTPIFGFGLPFGPTISLGRKWDTEFKIHACLVGGYVAIPELGDESNATQEHFGVQLKPFRKFPVWQRMLVAAAGVHNNIVFAWLCMFIMLTTLGVPKQDVVVHSLPPSNPIARDAGVLAGDRIVGIDEKKMASVDDVIQYLGKHKSETVELHIFRPDQPDAAPEGNKEGATEKGSDTKSGAEQPGSAPAKTDAPAPGATGAEKTNEASKEAEDSADDDSVADMSGKMVDLKVTTNSDGKVGMALVSKGKTAYQKVDGSPLDIAVLSVSRLWTLSVSMVDAMGMMCQGIGNSITSVFTGGGSQPAPGAAAAPKMGIDDLHGVLAVVKIGAEIAQQDWTQLFMFTIMISMDLAIINLLPIPALDGGHLAFMLFEMLRGKPMNERVQGALVKWGFCSLLVLMAVIMVNDIRAWFTGQLDLKVKSGKKHERKIERPVEKKDLPPSGDASQTPTKTDTSSPVPSPAP
jgi:regulator of sigma E protease